jgi:hypothetical protein
MLKFSYSTARHMDWVMLPILMHDEQRVIGG